MWGCFVCRGKKEIMKNRKWKKLAAFALVSAMAVSMAACGGDSQGSNNRGQGDNSGNGVEAKEFVYVPEFQELQDENASYYNMKYVGDALYYENYFYDEATGESGESIVKYSLADGSSSPIPIELGENVSMGEFAVAADGSIYTVIRDYSGEPGPEGYTEPKNMLTKFGPDGAQAFSQDLTEILAQDPENSYIQQLSVDGEGRIYVSVNSKIMLFDAEGNYKGDVNMGENWINGMGPGKDGRMYICYYDYSSEGNNYVLTVVDYDAKSLGESYKGFISGSGNGLYTGAEYDFLVSDSTSVYAYDLKSQTNEKLFDWLDSDINGSGATCLGQLEDGRILAMINDWESNDNGLALLTKTKSSEVAPRETILIGAMYSDSNLQAAAVKFNKSSDKYRISIKTYVDYNNWTETSWTDALTNLNNDITSNNCPDIIDLTALNVQQLAAKGVFEDLTPYLEQSGNLKKEDFIDNVIDAYTYDGVLVSIPANFELQTVMGSASELGGKEGWTIDEMIAYADAHPEAQLFDYSDKAMILDMCMRFNESAFIDWDTGECKFDSPEFKSLLEFVNRFPDEWKWEDGGASTPTRIQNGEILLNQSYIYDFNELQLSIEMFGGDVACIGYPTTDGKGGTGLTASQAYAITSKSGHKEGAWSFIENFLTPTEERTDNRGRFGGFGFPNSKERLQAMAEEAVKVQYVTDENGEIIKDENGNPIEQGVGMGVGYEDGWSYEYRRPTQEEVDIILELINTARPITNSNDEVMNIIKEEAEAYFKGQKSVDAVVDIIQSCVNVYVGEHS